MPFVLASMAGGGRGHLDRFVLLRRCLNEEGSV